MDLRDQIIARAISEKLGYRDTQILLTTHKQPILCSRIRRDTIFIWALFHNRGINTVNELCDKYECEQLNY